jgi:hypothetical protein
MELRNKEELRNEILQYWLQSAWVYPFEGPDERTYLRLTPGGRLKMRRRIGELEKSLGVDGVELARQEEAGTLPVERDRLELAMMVHAYDTERRLIQSQGATLGTPAVMLEDPGKRQARTRRPDPARQMLCLEARVRTSPGGHLLPTPAKRVAYPSMP